MGLLSINAFAGVNYWAVLVAGLLTFFLGGLWYSPVLFEQIWMQANGYEEQQVRELQSALGPVGFASAAAAYLLMALVFAYIMTLLGIDRIAGGLLVGALIWLGFVASTGLTVNLFSIRPLSAWLIDAGFQLVFLLASGVILAAWR